MFKIELNKYKNHIEINILNRPSISLEDFKPNLITIDFNTKKIFYPGNGWNDTYMGTNGLSFIFCDFGNFDLLAKSCDRYFLNLSLPIGSYKITEFPGLTLDQTYKNLIQFFSILNKVGIKNFLK